MRRNGFLIAAQVALTPVFAVGAGSAESFIGSDGILVGADAVADHSDSVRVEKWLKEADLSSDEQNKILLFAKGFLGTPYAGGTLETFPFERLVVRMDSVDCTTFAEYVLALTVTDYLLHSDADSHLNRCLRAVSASSKNPYQVFKKALQTIRYRDGQLNGYTSRLHYFSDWIADNERKGLVREVTKESPYAIRSVDLNFMSEHASLYPFLAKDTLAVGRMRAIEANWSHFQMPYIPKEKLNEGVDVLKIKDGDILTLVTNINGLDVVHVGLACWMKGELHLLHASSAKKRVLLDPISLYQYTKNKKSQIGIRVIRITL